MRRRVILEESGEEDMAKFELQDTVTLTPTEKVKKIDLSKYGKEEFVIYGDIPLTANASRIAIGAGNINATRSARNSDVYSCEMIAHVFMLGGIIRGNVSFDDGWDGGKSEGYIGKTPRVTDEVTGLTVSFYPYVQGDEPAVFKIYGR